MEKNTILCAFAITMFANPALAVLDQWGAGAESYTSACSASSTTCSSGTSPFNFGPYVDNFQQPSAISSIDNGQGSSTGRADFEALTPILDVPLLRSDATGGSDIAVASSWALMGYTYTGATPGVVTVTGMLTGTVSNPIGSSFNEINGRFYFLSESALDGYGSTQILNCLGECFNAIISAELTLETTGSDSTDLMLDVNPGDTFYLFAWLNVGGAVGGFSDASNSLSFVFSDNAVLQSIATGGEPDADNDGVADAVDNCTLVANPDQRDPDGDGIGSLCDADITNDCSVNFGDVQQFSVLFFGADPVADLTGDGIVNFADVQILRDTLFGPPGPAADPNICTPLH